ncbi:Flp pilus assembly protein CpaB [Paramicrobacterium agarici]|uniref:Pilus assembly protein CpaB n=1 Tax=Paramicrobacterium agarici TaxID=630514 RepID=A0A2A9DSA4_9MICO|nr:RcpC/CpaB family pilus assembly protein [Microbacterium agarici]PFG29558.1 pilus assembly protein CpaB [Microbacterium agarici]TQO22563.1 pilus assembly protein CpaB [Microbacterium agarici]
MKIRIISAIVALVLAIVGTIAISSYVQDADRRAFEGAKLRDVFVVTKAVPAGTPSAELETSVSIQSLPVSAVPADAVSDLAAFAHTVTAVDLVPGEQLLGSRLVDPSELQSSSSVPVPEGFDEVSVQLTPDRMVGGQVKAGDTVGIYISFGDTAAGPASTQLEFQKVLVTNVQGAPVQDGEAAPSGAVLVTLARPAADAEKIIYAAQYGSIWLSRQPADGPTAKTDGARQESFS